MLKTLIHLGSSPVTLTEGDVSGKSFEATLLAL